MSDHGVSRYSNDGCRCDVCRDANAAWQRQRRRQRFALVKAEGLPLSVKHGASAYSNWGCRCDICTWASSVAQLRTDNDRQRAIIERLEIEKHNLAERLAEVEAASWKDAK